MSMALRKSKAGCLKVIEYDRGLQSADRLEIVPPLRHLMFAPLEPALRTSPTLIIDRYGVPLSCFQSLKWRSSTPAVYFSSALHSFWLWNLSIVHLHLPSCYSLLICRSPVHFSDGDTTGRSVFSTFCLTAQLLVNRVALRPSTLLFIIFLAVGSTTFTLSFTAWIEVLVFFLLVVKILGFSSGFD